VIHEEGQELPENIPDYENETEDNDREKEIHHELASDIAVNQFHRLPFVWRKIVTKVIRRLPDYKGG
jgi:hypothetical protein